MREYNPHTDSSMGFFLRINLKLTLKTSLKDTIDDIVTWLDLDDEDTKLLLEEKIHGETITQRIVILIFDIH